MKARISAVVNTLNEEKHIGPCLECLRWCDEIVVVDMYSDDRTLEIAREYTDKVFCFERVGYVEPARKFAVDKTTSEWVLIVDADERIPRKLGLTLKQIASTENECVAYLLPRKNYILGKCIQYSGWNSDYQMRFFKKGSLIFSDEIHNTPKPEGKIGHVEDSMEESIIHFNYLNSQQFVERLNKYTTVEAKHLSERKEQFKFYKLITVPFKEFYSRFITLKGFKEGLTGFILSIFMAFYRFLTWAKYWEIFNKIDAQAIYDEINKRIIEEHKNDRNRKL